LLQNFAFCPSVSFISTSYYRFFLLLNIATDVCISCGASIICLPRSGLLAGSQHSMMTEVNGIIVADSSDDDEQVLDAAC
jgi:hypothetical protein